MKLNQKIVIIGRDPDLIDSGVIAEPKVGTKGKFKGTAPVPGKISIEFRATALGYSYDEDNPTITIYIREEMVAAA